MTIRRAVTCTTVVLLALCMTGVSKPAAAQSGKKPMPGSTKSSGKTVKTDPLKMTGVRPRVSTTGALKMTGARFTQKTVSTAALQMTGAAFTQKQVKTEPITMTGIRQQ